MDRWIDRLLGSFLGRLVGAGALFGGTIECYWWLNAHLPPRYDLLTPVDTAIPFLPWMILVYLSYTGLMVAMAWFADAREFRRLALAVLLGNALCYVGFFLFTAHYPRPPLETIDPLWRPLYATLRGSDGPGNTFPSTHVAMTSLLGLRLARRPGAPFWVAWAALIDLSTLTVKQHFVGDVAGGLLVAWLAHAVLFPPVPAPAGPPVDLRPRHRLNAVLAVGVVAGLWALQALAARQSSWGAIVGIGAIYATLQLPLYSLLHEAEHRIFDPRQRVNDAFGLVLASTFPCSFTFLRACHMGHHGRNRTDAEMFDEYYPGADVAKKYAQFYFLYLGGFWLSVALSNVVLLVWEGFCRTRLMQSTPPVAAMVNGVARSLVRRVRLECLAVLASQALSFWVLDLRLGSWLVLYGMHGLLWSSQNYVNHSGSPRRVADGAHNLVTHWLHERLILNFNWHLAHHQHPNVPWHLLPRFDDASRVRPGYLSNLLRFWRGPRETTEPSPRPEHDSVFVP